MAKLNTDARTLLLAALSVGGGLAAYAAVRKWNESDLSGRVVLITGATRGLGLALARECAAQGARLALTARDQDELDKVRREFVQDNHAVLTLPCDVTDQGQVMRLIDRVTDHYGQIDVLVNNAGTIQVAPVVNMTLADFERAMATNFYGVLHTVLAVMPQMRNRKQGHIVNVTSIGGKVAMPHLLPYSCSKFAATALSEGLHAELAGDGVHVLTVVPGLLRTGSYVNAEYKGNVEDEARWFSFGEMGPGSMDPARAARQIVKALRQGEAELILSAGAQLLARMSGSAPSLTQRLLALVNEYGLPAPGPHQDVVTGQEVRRQSETLQTLSNTTRSTAELYNQPQS